MSEVQAIGELRGSWLSRLLCRLGIHQPITTWGTDVFLGGYCLRCRDDWQLPSHPPTLS